MQPINDLLSKLVIREAAVAEIAHAAYALPDFLQQIGLLFLEVPNRSLKFLCRSVQLRDNGVDIMLQPPCSSSRAVQLSFG